MTNTASKIDVSIVIPAYNEEKRLPIFLEEVIRFVSSCKRRYEIIVVDDGSKDGTSRVAKSFFARCNTLSLITLKINRGKGYAVKRGLFKAKGRVRVFLDADGSVHPREIEKNIHFLEEGHDVVIGSRVKRAPDQHLKREWFRVAMGVFFNFMVQSILRMPFEDTQCGFKMFKAHVIKPVFSRMRLHRFGFDIEMLFLIGRCGFNAVEVPVSWAHQPGSKVNVLTDSIKMFFNIIQVRYWHGMTRSVSRRNPWMPDLSHLIFWIAFVSCFRSFFIEFDTFWHIRTGEWIWQHRTAPHWDPGFSLSATPLPWDDNQWLAQLVLYSLYQVGGFLGLRILLSLIPALIFQKVYRVFRARGVKPLAAVVVVLIATAATSNHWLARPHFLAYLCVLASVMLWRKARESRVWYPYAALLFVQLLWVNLHQTFVVQFILASAFSAEVFLNAVIKRKINASEIGKIIAIDLLLLAVCLLNPNGARVFHSPSAVWRIHRFIEEWQPLLPSMDIFWYFLLYIAVFAASLWADRARVSFSELFIMCGSAFLVSLAVRNVPIFVWVTLPSYAAHVPVLCGRVGQKLSSWRAFDLFWRARNENLENQERQFDGTRLTQLVWSVMLLLSISSFHVKRPILWDGIHGEKYPVKTVDVIEKENIKGRIFTDFAWGGYLIFRLRNGSQVFIDGRADMYGPERMEEFYRLYKAEGDWKDLITRYDIDTVVSMTSWRLTQLLSKDADWGLVYSDPHTSLLVKKSVFPQLMEKYPDVSLAKTEVKENR